MATRILIVTDSAVLPSGMAETTRLIFETLLDRYPGQYEIHQVGLFHCYAVIVPRWPIYPTRAQTDSDGEVRFDPEDKYGQKTFPECVARIRPDIVFAFGDPQRVFHLCVPAAARSYRLILHVNFDGLPLPPGYADALRHADQIITKSEFSRNVLAAALPEFPAERLTYMYSPADTDRFQPIRESERVGLRNDLLPAWMPRDGFVLGWIGRNQWRKQIWLLYKAIHYLRSGAYLVCQACQRISVFDWDPSRQTHSRGQAALESRPGYSFEVCSHCESGRVTEAEPLLNVFLWLHMAEEPEDEWPARSLEGQFGLERGRDLHYTEDYTLKSALAPADLPLLFNVWDGLLYLSGGEGFGLPAWEAMCSGLPVVYTNYSSHAEFLTRGQAGLPVGGILQPERKSCIWRLVADLGQTIESVRKLYFDQLLRKQLGQNGRTFALQFKAENQVQRWHQIFQQR